MSTGNPNSISRGYDIAESSARIVITTETYMEGIITDGDVAVYQYCYETELCNERTIRNVSFLFAMIIEIIGLLLVK